MLRRLLSRPLTKSHFSNIKRLRYEDLYDPSARSNGIIPVREYMKWLNKPYVMVWDDFFNSRTLRNNLTIRSDTSENREKRIVDFEPFFSEAMAKWLWTTYTLNDYPYFDLNIVTVFTNLPKALDACNHVMNFFENVLQTEQFKRINYFMVPLYRMDRHRSEEQLLHKCIPGKVQIINDIKVSPFHVLGMEHDHTNTFWVQDPVYIVLLDDIIKYMAQDQIKINSKGELEQGYLRFNSSGDYFRKEYYKEIDPLCSQTIDILQNTIESTPEFEQYIPSQLIQLFEVISSLTPEYRIFAIDLQKDPYDDYTNWWWTTWYNKLTHWGNDHDEYTTGSNVLLTPEQEEQWNHTTYKRMMKSIKPRDLVSFTANFKQIEKICLNFNPNVNAVKLQSLYQFMNQWYQDELNVVPNASSYWKQLKRSQLKLITYHLV